MAPPHFEVFMHMSKHQRWLLIFSGLSGVVFGSAILFVPLPFLATAGIVLSPTGSLLSELRAPGGALLASGVFVGLGAFVPRFQFAATVIATLLGLGYGSARVLSLVVDGVPAPALLGACALELTVGLGCLLSLTAGDAPKGLTLHVPGGAS